MGYNMCADDNGWPRRRYKIFFHIRYNIIVVYTTWKAARTSPRGRDVCVGTFFFCHISLYPYGTKNTIYANPLFIHV